MTGYCNKCHKVWTLEAGQGLCRWCGELADCQGQKIPAKHRVKSRSSGTNKQAEIEAIAEQSYDQLDGDWLDWLEVARRYERKVPYQDRQDIRHTIILELALARRKTTEPIPIYRAYRIASYMVADYYRKQRKLNTGLDCKNCNKAKRLNCEKHNLYGECTKLIKLEYLEAERLDSDGNRVTLKDTLADDKAIDLDQWIDNTTFLLGCPLRLIELAYKRQAGIPLTDTDRRYYNRQREKERKRYQKPLF